MDKLLLEPTKDSIIFEDDKLYVCLASYPITHGHALVVWKEKVEDLHLLKRADYEYLMDSVDMTRNVLMKYFNVEKVYLMYLDEAKQVHWHLVPRYNDKGYNVFSHEPELITAFDDADKLRELFKEISSRGTL